jgi:hypothetical protein
MKFRTRGLDWITASEQMALLMRSADLRPVCTLKKGDASSLPVINIVSASMWPSENDAHELTGSSTSSRCEWLCRAGSGGGTQLDQRQRIGDSTQGRAGGA